MTQRRTYLLFAGCFFLFIWGTWQVPLLGPDEPRYAQVGREMFESGEYFVPRLGGLAWFEKPVLLYWLMCLSYGIFGINEFAARLPSVLAGLGSIWFLHHTLRLIAGPNIALLGAATLGSTAFFAGFSHAATFDMLLTFCVTASLCCYLLYEYSQQQMKWLMLMYAFAGLGVLAKGFVALIVIGITLLSYLVWTGRWKNIFSLKPFHGAAITAAVIALWFLPVSLIYGIRFWEEFVYRHHFVRYTSSFYHRSQGLLFYVPILIAGTYPWTLAPLVSRFDLKAPLIRFALCWLLAPFLFFSLSQTKLPGYILPAVPAFGILAGISLSRIEKGRRLVILSAALQLLMIGALFWASRKYSVPLEPILCMIGILIACTTAGTILLFLRKWTAAWISYAMILFAAMVLFVFALYPRLPWSDSKMLAVQWAVQEPNNNKLVPYNVYDFGPVFYTNGRLELDPRGYPRIITNAPQLHRYLRQEGQAHVFTGNDDLEWMLRAEFWIVENVLKGRERSIVQLRPK